MEVHKDRRVLLPHAGGKTDLRTRLLEVFQQADSKGTPGGTLDATELASKIGRSIFLLPEAPSSLSFVLLGCGAESTSVRPVALAVNRTRVLILQLSAGG